MKINIDKPRGGAGDYREGNRERGNNCWEIRRKKEIYIRREVREKED